MELVNMTNEEKLVYFNKLRTGNRYILERDYNITKVTDDGCEMTFVSMPEKHANIRGDVHGGVYASLADSTMGTACFMQGKGVVTLDLSGNYLKSIKAGETFVCKGHIEHNGRRTMVTSCKIYNKNNEVCYVGHGTFFVVDTLTDVANLHKEENK